MTPSNPSAPLDRRRFIQTTATAGAALTLTASQYARVLGANDRLGIAMIGVGGRAQAHIDLLMRMKRDGIAVDIIGVCDVWDGWEDEYAHEFPPGHITRRKYAQGLLPSARKCGLNPNDSTRVTKDYHRLLERSDVDAVCIATPDHWHARMTIDAVNAGKHVFCESPLTRTSLEADQVREAVQRSGRVLTVCVPSLADPGVILAREALKRGRIGPIVHAQAGVHRNDIRGMWRFYRTIPSMNLDTIDWPQFLGTDDSTVMIPFDRNLFAQWRTSLRFGNGPLSDLLIHPLSRMLAITGLRKLKRVTAGGGLFLEQDGRDVPDVVTLLADFAEGCQIALTATTVSGYPQEEVLRGRLGAMRFEKGAIAIVADDPSRGSILPARLEGLIPAQETFRYAPERQETRVLWEDFLHAIRDQRLITISPLEIGVLASRIVYEGVKNLS